MVVAAQPANSCVDAHRRRRYNESKETNVTLVVDLTAEQEKRLRELAAERGMKPDDYARDLLTSDLISARPRRSARGKYAHIPAGSEEFAARKAAEKAREDRFGRVSGR